MNSRILILDDDEAFALTLSNSLKRRHLIPHIAHHPDDAVSLCRQFLFTYMTVDLRLEHESGLRWLPTLRALQPEARILVLTGYASIATAVQAMKLGADNYLAKPAGIREILLALTSSNTEDVDVELKAEEVLPVQAACVETNVDVSTEPLIQAVQTVPTEETSLPSEEEDQDADDWRPMSVQRLEWEHIQRVLQEHEGNVSAAARAMNMHRRTLQRKLEKRPVRF